MTIQRIHSEPANAHASSEIHDVLDELAQLAHTVIDAESFYRTLLSKTVQMLAACGGWVWRVDSAGQLQPGCNIPPESNAPPWYTGHASAVADHAKRLDSAMRSDSVLVIPPQTGNHENQSVNNPSEWLLVLGPLKDRQEPIGMLEIVQRPTRDLELLQGNQRVLEMVAQIAIEFHQHQQLAQLRDNDVFRQELDGLVQEIDQCHRAQRAAYALVNEGRRLLGCDRLSLVWLDGSSCRLEAVSGVETISGRSNTSRSLQRLATGLRQERRVCVFDRQQFETGDSNFPEVTSFFEQQTCQRLATFSLFPLKQASPNRDVPIGVLIAEQSQPDSRLDASEFEQLGKRVLPTLVRIRELESLPLLPLVRFLGQVRRWFFLDRLPKTMAVVAIATLVVLALVLIPMELKIKVHGQVQPLNRRNIFAPQDSRITSLAIKHDAPVAAGDLLMQLNSSPLDVDFQRLEGEMETTREKLSAIHTARVLNNQRSGGDPRPVGHLTAEEEELKKQLASLQRQRELLLAQRRRLTIHSPIAGRVVTWNVQQLLEGRPVRRGQALIQIADVDGPWILELQVPDSQVGHLLDSGPNNSVSFVMALDPDTTLTGRVREVAKTTLTKPGQPPSVLVTVEFDRGEVPLLRPGSSVVAKIHCGPHSMGYVWFHQLYETIRTQFLF